MTCGPLFPTLCLRVCRVHGVCVDSEPVPIPPSGLTIGSEGKPGSLYLDPSLYVAPTHAMVSLRNGEWRVTPLSSRAVTTLNDRRLEAEETAVLTPGDRLEVGFVSLLVEQARTSDIVPPDSMGALDDDPLEALTNSEAPELEALLGLSPGTGSASETATGSLPRFPENLETQEPRNTARGLLSPQGPHNAAQTLVELLAEDARREDAFPTDSDPLASLLETAATPPGKEAGGSEAGIDILERLARESEQVLSGPGHGNASLRFLTEASPSGTDLWHEEEIDPLALLAPPDGASLGDVLEGPLSIDDVLEQLGGGCAFPEEEPVPDPLLLLARSEGGKPHRAAPALADILNRDHHRLSIETPYQQRGTAEASAPLPVRNHSEEEHERAIQGEGVRQNHAGFPDWGTGSGRGIKER